MDHHRIIQDHIEELTGEKLELEIPDPSLGDFALPCFPLARKLKKNPAEISEDLAKQVQLGDAISKVEVKGPYLNFFINQRKLAEEILPLKEDYGKSENTGKVILLESPSPNTNKPLHVGHLRNILLGDSMKRILAAAGHTPYIVNMVNDRGVHICKSMLAYKKWGNDTPESAGKKPDHFVGDYYVLFSKNKTPELEEEAQQMLERWEKGDEEVIALWKKMNNWVLQGFEQTFERLDFRIDKNYYESDIYHKGKEIIMENTGTVFQEEEDGSVTIDLEDKNLGKKIVLRANKTAVYMTQDIYLAKLRHEDFTFDKMIYIVGNEQKYHFNVLFEIYRRLGYSFADDCIHLAYGMIELPEGKMKSREGTVIDADDLLDEVHQLTLDEIDRRYEDLTPDERDLRSNAISEAAIRFFFLKFNPLRDFVFKPSESISFDGETGPYIQYTHARLCSILRKGERPTEINCKAFREDETKEILKLINDFPGTIRESAERNDPSVIARYLVRLSQLTNEFYHKYPVLKEEDVIRDARLELIDATRKVIKEGLELLGITALERM
ncbi:MAG: arginine--tRNA ligase [Candidatus Woesearchaeota archaeon]